MKRWEYRVLDATEAPGGGLFTSKKREDIEAYLNHLGREGWEIISLDYRDDLTHGIVFKGVAKREVEAA